MAQKLASCGRMSEATLVQALGGSRGAHEEWRSGDAARCVVRTAGNALTWAHAHHGKLRSSVIGVEPSESISRSRAGVPAPGPGGLITFTLKRPGPSP